MAAHFPSLAVVGLGSELALACGGRNQDAASPCTEVELY